MVNKLKIVLLSFALFALCFSGALNAHAAAGDVVWTADTTLDMAIDLTVVGGSTASSFVVTDPTITVNAMNGDVFRVATVGSGSFSVDVSTDVTITCNSSAQARVEIAATTTQAYVITPSNTPCIYYAGGGSVGGSGGSSTASDTTPPTGSVSINQGVSVTNSATVALNFTSSDASQMMVSNNIDFTGSTWETYSPSKVWTLTTGDGMKTVYVKFKDAAGNVSGLASDSITLVTGTTSTGHIPGCGNRTTGFSESTGQSCVGNVVAAPSKVYALGTVTLKNGSRGEAVKELQRLLNDLLNLGLKVDGILGPKTIAVIKVWQKNNNLVADGLVGPKTKAAMKAQAEK